MMVLQGKRRQLTDTTSVVRVLPQVARRHVGPFVFLDHFGPANVGAEGVDVPPHPHIGLATVTVLYEGAMRHRDSLGSDQWIRPGAVNWMTAGRGIVHSERSEGHRGPMHGLQLWVALPHAHQDVPPSFQHLAAAQLPHLDLDGVEVSVCVGHFGAVASPVATYGPTHLALATLEAGASLEIPLPPAGQELGIMVVTGRARVGDRAIGPDHLAVLEPAASHQGRWVIAAEERSRVAILGGEPVGPRTIVWNFVHADPARIQQAKDDWQARRFPEIPGDHDTWIPLPS